MTKGEISKSIYKAVIEWMVKNILPWLLPILVGLSTVFISIKNELVKHPYILLVSLAIMTATTALFVMLWIRLRWRYAWFHEGCGVLWDRNYRMRCMNCKKPLKHSSDEPSKFYCSDPKCNNKHVLRDDKGNKITEQHAKLILKYDIHNPEVKRWDMISKSDKS